MALIKFTALKQSYQGNSELMVRDQFDPDTLQITGEPTRKIGNVSWIEGGGKGSSVWKFKGLYSKDRNDDLEIKADFLVESKKRYDWGIPVNIKIINHVTGKVLTESIEISRNKPGLLRLNGESLEGSGELTIVVSPENSGDYIGISSDSLRVFFGKKSFGYNFLKGLTIISFQFFLMVIIAVLGSTFLSLPVNILFCLFVFFCGNITDFMRDLSTVINVFETHEHEHGLSALMKKSNVFVILLDYVIRKPILLLSYILPDLRNFSVGKYFTDGINIPCKTVFMSFGYAVLYTFFCLPVSFVVFKRREMA